MRKSCFISIVFCFLLFSCSKKEENLSVKKYQNFIVKILNEREFRPNVDTTSQKILVIGDSMAHFLERRLNDYCTENQHSFEAVSWVSANTRWFAETDTIEYFIKKTSPTYIFFVIGSNKVFLDEKEKLKEEIQKIDKKFGDIKTIWIGAPNWGGNLTLDNLILDEFGERKFFQSNKLTFEMKAKGDFHPSIKSSEMWVDSIASWVVKTSDFPIKMDYPKAKSQNDIIETILLPLEQ